MAPELHLASKSQNRGYTYPVDWYAMGVTVWEILSGGGSLAFNGVQQNLEGDCADGVCGPVPTTPGGPPCDPNDYSPPADVTYSIPLMTSELEGFSRVETAGDAPPITGY